MSTHKRVVSWDVRMHADCPSWVDTVNVAENELPPPPDLGADNHRAWA